MSFAKLAGDNPFLLWALHLNHLKALDVKEPSPNGVRDIVLDAMGSKRFGVGVKDGTPYLGYVDTDRSAIESVKWTSAAILFNKQDKDWIALSSKDARPDGSQVLNPVPIRLFVPVSKQRLLAFKELLPKELILAPLERRSEKDVVFSTSIFKKLPLKVS